MSFTHAGRTLSKVAVIGSGQIGPDIALYFAKVLSPFGVRTVVVDVSEDALAKGKAKLEKKIGQGVESGAFTAEQQAQMVGSVTFTSDYGQVKGADLVVEAATENKELKGKIFAQVEDLVAPDAILVGNSSHLEPEVIFAGTRRKDRTGVVHYFFPAERNLMVEVVSGKDTAPATAQWLMSFYEAIGKVPKYQELLSLAETEEENYYWASWFLLLSKQNEPAKKVLYEGLGKYPESTALNKNLAHYWVLSGRFKEAEPVYRRYADKKIFRKWRFNEYALSDLEWLESAGLFLPDKEALLKLLQECTIGEMGSFYQLVVFKVAVGRRVTYFMML